MEVGSLAIIALLVVLISVWLSKWKSVKNPLPGPTGLPIVGYMPFLTMKPFVKLAELAKEYGPVYKIRIGSKEIVVLCDFQSMKDAFSRDSYIGRPPDLPFDLSETTQKSGAFLGPPWKEQRRFSLHMLRDLGFGKTRMEEHVKEEILELLDRLASTTNTPVKMSDILAPSMSNNIASLIFGKRMKYNDPKRVRLDHLLSEVGKLAGALGWQTFFPLIRAFSVKFNIGKRARLTKVFDEVKKFCRNEMMEHESTLDANNIRDFMDGYLLEIEKKSNDPSTTFTKDMLIDLSRAFFGAGSETVRITVDWMLLVAAAYPEVQKKIQAEIDEVLGLDGFPTGQDRLRMPFTEAAILETMRWKTIVPLNIMRYTLEDTELNGYFVPKHSHVLAVLWSIDHDASLWGNDVFDYKPQRFLSEDGKKVVKPEYFIPFSVGKRSCPGKSLAEMEVFLYVVAILQKFKITLPPGKVADLDGFLGIALQPKRQDVILKIRSKN